MLIFIVYNYIIKAMKSNEKLNKLQEEVTSLVIEELEKGQIMWLQPWAGNLPENAITNKKYEGFNSFFLQTATRRKKYKTSKFLTYKQGQEIGANVRRGEKGYNITYWIIKEIKEDEQDESTEKESMKRFSSVVWTVFNLDQFDNVPQEYYNKATSINQNLNEDFSKCQDVVKNMPKVPNIEIGKCPCYITNKDTVEMPPIEVFVSQEHYYSALFHELTHSTGHHSRLDRFEEEEKALDRFEEQGGNSYAREELTAEFGAAFLCAHTNIFSDCSKNTAAYIQHWLKELKNDKKILFYAANKGSKAANFILNDKANNLNESQDEKTTLAHQK